MGKRADLLLFFCLFLQAGDHKNLSSFYLSKIDKGICTLATVAEQKERETTLPLGFENNATGVIFQLIIRSNFNLILSIQYLVVDKLECLLLDS